MPTFSQACRTVVPGSTITGLPSINTSTRLLVAVAVLRTLFFAPRQSLAEWATFLNVLRITGNRSMIANCSLFGLLNQNSGESDGDGNGNGSVISVSFRNRRSSTSRAGATNTTRRDWFIQLIVNLSEFKWSCQQRDELKWAEIKSVGDWKLHKASATSVNLSNRGLSQSVLI